MDLLAHKCLSNQFQTTASLFLNLSPFINTLKAFLSELVIISLHQFFLSQFASSPTAFEALHKKILFFSFVLYYSGLPRLIPSPSLFSWFCSPHSWLVCFVAGPLAKKLRYRACPPISAMQSGQCLSCHLSQQWACCSFSRSTNSWDKSSTSKNKTAH